uniref:Uncharacterized protein n=1 Tax=Arundo donax TaxID=35708 RepID=A0A0A9D6T1_ARUDO
MPRAISSVMLLAGQAHRTASPVACSRPSRLDENSPTTRSRGSSHGKPPPWPPPPPSSSTDRCRSTRVNAMLLLIGHHLSSQPLRSADNVVRHTHAEQGNKQAGWRMEMHRPLPGCCRRCCESSKRYERMGHMSFPMSVVLFCFHFFPNKR